MANKYFEITPVAKTVPYNNATSGLAASNTQDAIDLLASGSSAQTFQMCAAYITGSTYVLVTYQDLIALDLSVLTEVNL